MSDELTFKELLRKADKNGKLDFVKDMLVEAFELRFCSICGKAFSKGYYDGDNWGRHYCSDKCLHTCYTSEEWDEAYGDGETENYWSDWEGDPEIIRLYNEFLEEKASEKHD